MPKRAVSVVGAFPDRPFCDPIRNPGQVHLRTPTIIELTMRESVMPNHKEPNTQDDAIGRFAVGLMAVFVLVILLFYGFQFGVWLKG